MKVLIIILYLLCLYPSTLFAHGFLTIEDFQTFPETVVTQPVANVTGGIVAIPLATVCAVAGIVLAPIEGAEFGENTTLDLL